MGNIYRLIYFIGSLTNLFVVVVKSLIVLQHTSYNYRKYVVVLQIIEISVIPALG